ncbi:MAG: NAD-dependent epimerase/dehydratase family protein [Pirellulaceae bacterium]
MVKLIFGCGYLGKRVGLRWIDAGHEVHTVTRRQEKATELTRHGFIAHVADIRRPESLVGLPTADTVLFAVGYDRTSGESMYSVYVEGLANVLNTVDSPKSRWIYVSSTGVFGESHADWIDETTIPHPQREGGRVCLMAEQTLQKSRFADRAVVLRMAGLYGPGRIPRRREMETGQSIATNPGSYLNLIHIDDAAAVVVGVDDCPGPPSLLLVSDGHPVQRRDYYDYIARLWGLPAPLLVAPPVVESEGRGIHEDVPRRARGNKRIRNQLLRDTLPGVLRFPTYRDGLQSIVATEAKKEKEANEG